MIKCIVFKWEGFKLIEAHRLPCFTTDTITVTLQKIFLIVPQETPLDDVHSNGKIIYDEDSIDDIGEKL